MFFRKGIFKWLQYFNTVGFSLFLIIGISVGLFALKNLYLELTRPLFISQNLKLDEENSNNNDYALGAVSTLVENFITLPLLVEQKRQVGLHSKYSTNNIVNYLFIDMQSGENHQLLDHHNYLITDFITVTDLNEPKSNPKLLIFLIVKNGRNQDSYLKGQDIKTVAVSTIKGTKYTELFTDIISFYGATLISDKDCIIFYKDNKGIKLSVIDTETLSVKKTEILKTNLLNS